jgi:hypothetical protein
LFWRVKFLSRFYFVNSLVKMALKYYYGPYFDRKEIKPFVAVKEPDYVNPSGKIS